MKSRDQDEELFGKAVGDVKPLHHNLAEPKRERTTSTPVRSASVEITSEFGEELRFLRPGIQTSALQKLRRGQFSIEATLDLHGLTAAEASTQLDHFLRLSQTTGRAAVRIVHGKGHGSVGRQPILKSKVRQWLQEFPAVLAFCSARQRDGGTGAVDVLLRKK